MLSRRIVAARPLARSLVPATARLQPQFIQRRTALTAAEYAELTDPNQNGGYINPPPEKRSTRDPYGDYWDKQERRNYGEPCHEDNDILGVLSLHEYDHFTPGWGGILLGTFVASVLGLCGVVAMYYPDKKSAPKTYPDGLEVELGGKRALLVSPSYASRELSINLRHRPGSPVRDGRFENRERALCKYHGMEFPFVVLLCSLCCQKPLLDASSNLHY